MHNKPEGPIWVDMTETLMELSVNKLVLIANFSLNKLTVRDIGEVCFHAGLEPDIKLCEKEVGKL
jgi:hypothetical protein